MEKFVLDGTKTDGSIQKPTPFREDSLRCTRCNIDLSLNFLLRLDSGGVKAPTSGRNVLRTYRQTGVVYSDNPCLYFS